ncbi:MAG TPA: T9SS type A sorting domain-containing protein [Caldithrix abyssi]|uniref:T9SS type A sorting domain-containing protein n=1 Tax=Caldithrix abyssi TaxID=187145 RepID=A0A7V4U1X6_CALAY|nr:T9SS type A sorting domain-containing protein [Caldithrix abyssi]
MMLDKFLIAQFMLIAFFSSLSAQDEPVSIHQQQWQEHRHIAKAPSLFDASGADIRPLSLSKTQTLTRTVFGYLPDWEYYDARSTLKYDLLSHIAAFDFNVSASGSIGNPSYWPWTDVINAAHDKGVRVIMTAVNFDKDEIHTILTDTTVKNAFFRNVKSKIANFKLDGVNIDFEGLYTADRGSLLNDFMSELTDYVHTNLPGAEVSFAGPAVNWGGWDLAGLAASCDYIFIMGYAFAGSWNSQTGANAPLTGGSYNISNTVNVQYAPVTKNHPEKLILGVPYYGNRWKTQTGSAYSTIIEYINHPRFSSAMSEALNYGLRWDAKSQTPWYAYSKSGAWYQVWFDTDSSLGLKYDLAESKNYRGVGMWALGYDGARQELWDELRRRYVLDIIADGYSADLPPENFILFQNYPNPFNPATAIRYQLSVAGNVELAVYNLLGQKLTTLVNEGQTAGTYHVLFDGKGLAGGVYLYKLKVNRQVQSRKMILMR